MASTVRAETNTRDASTGTELAPFHVRMERDGETAIAADVETPFANIDSAKQYIGLLCDALRDARREVADDTRSALAAGIVRRVEALQLVTYKLDRLETHLESAGRLLNDLRMLRRLLLGERASQASPGEDE